MSTRPKRPQMLTDALLSDQRSKSQNDPLGSWTGVAWDEWDEPVQDADDL